MSSCKSSSLLRATQYVGLLRLGRYVCVRQHSTTNSKHVKFLSRWSRLGIRQSMIPWYLSVPSQRTSIPTGKNSQPALPHSSLSSVRYLPLIYSSTICSFFLEGTNLKDLAGIDAIPSFIDGNKINMSKVRKMATAIHACKKNAEIAYPLEPLQFVDQFLLFKLQVLTPKCKFHTTHSVTLYCSHRCWTLVPCMSCPCSASQRPSKNCS